ncbi:hypothetical protein GA830_18295 (plasmid) [Mesorhizobium sp. NBSH29]|nr:hypothetical protein GA830_18295 [Mesorhizobium sp. NBSH29]
MKNDIMKSGSAKSGAENAPYLFDDWFDPIEAGLRERVRGFIETLRETELDEVLAGPVMADGRPKPNRAMTAPALQVTATAAGRAG